MSENCGSGRVGGVHSESISLVSGDAVGSYSTPSTEVGEYITRYEHVSGLGQFVLCHSDSKFPVRWEHSWKNAAPHETRRLIGGRVRPVPCFLGVSIENETQF